MRLRPRTKEQAFKAVEGLKDPGQKAYLVKMFDGDGSREAIRICTPTGIYSSGVEITKPEQLEVKEYQIII